MENMEYIVILLASLIIIILLYLIFNSNLTLNGYTFNDRWREKISKRPYSDYEGTVWISKNLHRLQEVDDSFRRFRKKKEKPTVFNIKDTDYYVVFYNDWHFALYYTKDIRKLNDRYSLCGCSLKSDWISFREEAVGRKVQKWYIDRYGTLGYQ